MSFQVKSKDKHSFFYESTPTHSLCSTRNRWSISSRNRGFKTHKNITKHKRYIHTWKLAKQLWSETWVLKCEVNGLKYWQHLCAGNQTFLVPTMFPGNKSYNNTQRPHDHRAKQRLTSSLASNLMCFIFIKCFCQMKDFWCVVNVGIASFLHHKCNKDQCYSENPARKCCLAS